MVIPTIRLFKFNLYGTDYLWKSPYRAHKLYVHTPQYVWCKLEALSKTLYELLVCFYNVSF